MRTKKGPGHRGPFLCACKTAGSASHKTRALMRKAREAAAYWMYTKGAHRA